MTEVVCRLRVRFLKTACTGVTVVCTSHLCYHLTSILPLFCCDRTLLLAWMNWEVCIFSLKRDWKQRHCFWLPPTSSWTMWAPSHPLRRCLSILTVLGRENQRRCWLHLLREAFFREGNSVSFGVSWVRH